jgi:hypothetical protein
MSFGHNVRHIRELLGWSRSDMLRRLCPGASSKDRARVSQQVYQLERRSELLLPISEVLGIAPHILLNRDLTGMTLSEVKLLRPDSDAPVPGDLIALAGRIATATVEARAIVDKVFALDRDQPHSVVKLSIIVDAFLDGVRGPTRASRRRHGE